MTEKNPKKKPLYVKILGYVFFFLILLGVRALIIWASEKLPTQEEKIQQHQEEITKLEKKIEEMKYTSPFLEWEIQNGAIKSYTCKEKCNKDITLHINNLEKDRKVDGKVTYGGYVRYIVLQIKSQEKKSRDDLEGMKVTLMSWNTVLWSCQYTTPSVKCPDWPQRSVDWK